MRIVLVCYGIFNSNSGGHVAHFANALARLGHSVAMVADGDTDSVRDIVEPLFDCFTHEDVELSPEAILQCGDRLIPVDETVVHVWTPRENVILFTRHLLSLGVRSYFVHLEDNEEVVAAANLRLPIENFRLILERLLPDPYPITLSHPRHYQAFLKQATGVTVIVPTLAEFVPDGVPVHVLEPGVDVQVFGQLLSQDRERELREELELDPDEYLCVYHGNMHAANRREIFSLYTAFEVLRRRGRKVRLIRTGVDHDGGLDVSYNHLRDTVIHLGFVDKKKLIEILALANFFIQPGASNPFNDYRFPSKIPEFLAVGRPVVLPDTNIAHQMRDGVDALFLKRGDGQDIADQVERILDDPILAESLAGNGQAFAARNLCWDENAAKLVAFYQAHC